MKKLIIGGLVAALSLSAGCTLNLAGPQPYLEHTTVVTSADGTRLVAHYFPATGLKTGEQAPTIMIGSGWSFPAYPEWLSDLGGGGNFQVGMLMPRQYRDRGYNVVTWDNRGFGTSDGPVDLLNVNTTGADLHALVDWIATEPSAQLESEGDPIVGVTGGSYGGGISIVAGIDEPRVDAIIPNMAWNSLPESLYPDEVVNVGWGTLLCSLGDGLSYLFGQMGGPLGTRVDDRLGPRLRKVCGVIQTGTADNDDIEFMTSASPLTQVEKIQVPTLILAGTADTLFPLKGNITNYRMLADNNIPLKMMWYCGGHGLCNSGLGDLGHMKNMQLAWFDKYLKGIDTDTGPGFEWTDQNGAWQTSTTYPNPTKTITHTSSGTLNMLPFSFSGFFIVPTPAWNAITIPLPAPATPTAIVQAPKLTLKYRGTADRSNAAVFAQFIDRRNNTIAGSQITPIRLQLDGKPHELTVDLNAIAWNWDRTAPLALQITDSSTLYFREAATGQVVFDQIKVDLPTS